MATDLYAITNAILPKELTFKFIYKKIEELKALNISSSKSLNIDENGKETYEKDTQEWCFEVRNEQGFVEIYFNGGFPYSITLLANICYISTIYKYRLLYEIYDSYYLKKFRTDLYNIVKVFGGTEIIFLADNGCDKLSTYLELMAWENIPYQDIKQKMIQDLGQPITDYSQLDFDTLSYRNITEFVLDDFKDIFTAKLIEVAAEGGHFAIYKYRKQNTDNFYYFYKTAEIDYDLDITGFPSKKGKSTNFNSFKEAFKSLKSRYKSLFMFHPISVAKEIQTAMLNELDKEYINREKDYKYQVWQDQINYQSKNDD